MKVLKYNLCTKVNTGTIDEPFFADVLTPVVMGWNEVNEEIAKREAHNGEYTIEDDGQTEPEAPPSQEERISDLEDALNMILNGVTE